MRWFSRVRYLDSTTNKSTIAQQVGLQNIDAHTCCGVGVGHHAAESFNTKTMEWLARELPAMGTRFNDEAAAAAILTAHAKRWPGMLPLHVAASLGQRAHVEVGGWMHVGLWLWW